MFQRAFHGDFQGTKFLLLHRRYAAKIILFGQLKIFPAIHHAERNIDDRLLFAGI